MASKPRIKTVRCVIATGDRFLLAIHNNGLPINHRRWGLVGGRVDRGEAPEAAVRREVREELYIDIGELTEVGDFRYKGAWHRVFGVETTARVLRFDRSELFKIGWHTLGDVAAFEDQARLHTGFEHDAVRTYLQARQTRETP